VPSNHFQPQHWTTHITSIQYSIMAIPYVTQIKTDLIQVCCRDPIVAPCYPSNQGRVCKGTTLGTGEHLQDHNHLTGFRMCFVAPCHASNWWQVC
jgi:hypothetical protein